MKTVYQDENNVVLDRKKVERKPCINRESKSFEIAIKLYSCHYINMKFLVVVTPSSIYQKERLVLHKEEPKLVLLKFMCFNQSNTCNIVMNEVNIAYQIRLVYKI